MKKLSSLLLLFFIFSFIEKEEKNEKLEETILSIYNAFNAKDNDTFNRFIHPDGVIIHYRIGVPLEFSHVKKFDLKKRFVNGFPLDEQITADVMNLHSDSIPSSDCNDYLNESRGIFTFSLKKNLSTRIFDDNKQWFENKMVNMNNVDNLIIDKLEKGINPIQVIVSGEKNPTLRFTLALFGSKWYIIYFDFDDPCGI